jgi:hypothetical protein
MVLLGEVLNSAFANGGTKSGSPCFHINSLLHPEHQLLPIPDTNIDKLLDQGYIYIVEMNLEFSVGPGAGFSLINNF